MFIVNIQIDEFPICSFLWGWKTKAQIIELHGGDKDAAESIIANKISQGLVRDHPDTPGLDTYYVTWSMDVWNYGHQLNVP